MTKGIIPVCPICGHRARYDTVNDKFVHTNLRCPLHELAWEKIEEVRAFIDKVKGRNDG